MRPARVERSGAARGLSRGDGPARAGPSSGDEHGPGTPSPEGCEGAEVDVKPLPGPDLSGLGPDPDPGARTGIESGKPRSQSDPERALRYGLAQIALRNGQALVSSDR
jgi:hypothetical protein